MGVLVNTNSLKSPGIKLVPFKPLIKMKYVIAVAAIPPNKAPTQDALSLNLNDNNKRETYCTSAPIENATTTERSIPSMISVALAVLM